ncbi:MAG: tetratricopeptide repeat protein [Pseudomonadota bacterium]
MKDFITCQNPRAKAHFDAALRAFNVYRGDPVAHLDAALQEAPDFTMAHILKAYLFGLATEPDATAEARFVLKTARLLAVSEAEQSHIAGLDALLDGNWTAAAVTLDNHNMAHPHDLVALQAGHLMDFYRANARNLRDRISRVLQMWSTDAPGYSTLLGMYAFGLEETANYAQAEAVGKEAIARDPLDCWAHHAVAHVLEMQGRAEEGLRWMQEREPHWSGDDNFFQVHNWWHKGLYHLELGQPAEAVALYDARIRPERSPVALDLVDASALLWRLHLGGHDVGTRWAALATAWEAHADGKLYPFNDWHAAMAYLGAGRMDKVDRLVDQYRSADVSSSEVTRWAQTIGLPLIEGFKSFWLGRYDAAADTLFAARHIANAFGGSHAQRDIIDWTLVEAATRSGRRLPAEALQHERTAMKPHSPINRRFLQSAATAHA